MARSRNSISIKRCSSTASPQSAGCQFRWAEQQPEAFSDRTGKKDIRGAYGLHGREMILWLNQLQHARDKNVIFVGILERVVDEFKRREWQLQSRRRQDGA